MLTGSSSMDFAKSDVNSPPSLSDDGAQAGFGRAARRGLVFCKP